MFCLRFLPKSRRAGGQAHELEHQGFGQVGGGNAGRVEGLQKVEGVLQLVFVQHPFQGRVVDNVLNAVGEIALVVQEVDKDVDVGGFFVGKGVFAHLGVQVLVEIFFFGDVEPRVFGIVAAEVVAARHGGAVIELCVGKFVGFGTFEQGIVLQPVFDLAFEFDAGHLQDAQGLLQTLVELLGLPEFEAE